MMISISLLDKKIVAEQTLLLKFKRPKDYIFQAGQYAYLALLDKKYDDYDHHERILSFASAPNEPTLDFLIRLRDSGFKKEINELKIGESLYITEAIGNFTFPSHGKPIVCLAGGIGIAPFLSLIKEAVPSKKDSRLTLVWSNQTIKSTPLYDEVHESIQSWPHSQIINVLTRETNPNPPYVSGRITMGWLEKRQLLHTNTHYLLCGPTDFVNELSEGLSANKIPLDHIKLEAFTGY